MFRLFLLVVVCTTNATYLSQEIRLTYGHSKNTGWSWQPDSANKTTIKTCFADPACTDVSLESLVRKNAGEKTDALELKTPNLPVSFPAGFNITSVRVAITASS